MNDINPQNFNGASVTLVGNVGGPAEKPRYDTDDSSGVLELSIGVGEGYKGKDGEWVDKGTTWYTYSAVGAWGDKLRSYNKGDKVRIDNGKLEVRKYEKKDGTEGIGLNVRFGELSLVQAAKGASAAPAQADVWNAPTGGFGDETPF